MNHPPILGIATGARRSGSPKSESIPTAGYQGERMRKIFLNRDIEYRHFYLGYCLSFTLADGGLISTCSPVDLTHSWLRKCTLENLSSTSSHFSTLAHLIGRIGNVQSSSDIWDKSRRSSRMVDDLFIHANRFYVRIPADRCFQPLGPDVNNRGHRRRCYRSNRSCVA